MIRWILLLAVAVLLWIAEYKSELNDICSEFETRKSAGKRE